MTASSRPSQPQSSAAEAGSPSAAGSPERAPESAPSSRESLSPEQASAIRDRLADIAERAAAAATASGREARDVRILLATKTQPAAKIRAAIDAGFTLIGENRVQELQAKRPELADLDYTAHLIGPLQRNKVNHTLRSFASQIDSIDDLAVAQKLSDRIATLVETGELSEQAPALVSGDESARRLGVLIQVNTSREDSKSGVAPEAAEELVAAVRELEHLEIRGLMTIGLPGATDDEIRPSYTDLRELSERLREIGVLPAEAAELSMGMSGDFELAIAEGATTVRIGSSVFGARS